MTLKDFDDNLDCPTIQALADRLGITKAGVVSFLKRNGLSFPAYRASKGLQNESRATIPIDWDVVKERLKARSTATTIAKLFGISQQRFYDRCQAELGMTFQQLRADCHAEGEDCIKQKMYELAVTQGNTQMLIWLSRNWMKYNDRQEDSTGADKTVQINFVRK